MSDVLNYLAGAGVLVGWVAYRQRFGSNRERRLTWKWQGRIWRNYE